MLLNDTRGRGGGTGVEGMDRWGPPPPPPLYHTSLPPCNLDSGLDCAIQNLCMYGYNLFSPILLGLSNSLRCGVLYPNE
jgi:hypothetical protein